MKLRNLFSLIAITVGFMSFANAAETQWSDEVNQKARNVADLEQPRWPQVIDNQIYCNDEDTKTIHHYLVCHGEVITSTGAKEHPYCVAGKTGCPKASQCLAEYKKSIVSSSPLAVNLSANPPGTVYEAPQGADLYKRFKNYFK